MSVDMLKGCVITLEVEIQHEKPHREIGVIISKDLLAHPKAAVI